MTTSRATVRSWLQVQLDAALVGVGLPVKEVVEHKVDDLVGMTPLVAVLSVGSSRPRMTFSGTGSSLRFEVQVWVKQRDTGWTNAQAEDALDDIENRIAAMYEAATAYNVNYDGDTSVYEVTVSGKPYYLERIPTLVTLNRS